MAFITGLFLIDAPAAALNNGQSEDITATVKSIRVGNREYPYVSAQSFRYWLRGTLDKDAAWKASPVILGESGKKQQASTEGNPIEFWDDDLFGYMRAVTGDTVTRVSPFRTGTLVSIAPAQVVTDFGVMARYDREEGVKEGVLLHQHEFYRTVLQGLFSLDLLRVGTFTYRRRTGFRNLTDETREQAEAQGLLHLETAQAYRLPLEERVQRVQILLRALARVEGGAKQTLHYTDVTPAFMIAAVTRGGNHIFGRVVQADRDGQPQLNPAALDEALTTLGDEILSDVYVGRAQGFMDTAASILAERPQLRVSHPRDAFDSLAEAVGKNPAWLE